MIQMVRSQLRAFFWIFIFTALSVSFVPLTLGQERIEQAISEPKADVADFYQRQKMDEEIRSLRGELDLVKRRLVDLEKVQQLIRDLMQKVSRIEAQIRVGDGSSSLASVTDGLKRDLDLVASKVDSLDVDIRKSLEALAGDLSEEPVSLIQPERSAVRKATSSVNPPALADEKKDVKSFYSYAKNAYDSKRYDEAIELFGLLNNAFPENQYSQSGMY
ncbi:MAG: tetratricopeptide repeat protein, partial [Burkholderiales bacterium]|nr:tetratricopeptide repeat protein [Burkholderiales bacterium]